MGYGAGRGFVGTLELRELSGAGGELVEEPDTALQPYEQDLVATVAGEWKRRGEHSVCWGLKLATAMPVGGDSLGAAAAVGFSLLSQGRSYDSSCVLTAAVDRDEGLHPVGHEREKLEAALKGGKRRAGVSEETELRPMEIIDFASRGIEVRKLRTVGEAEEYASGLITELRRFARAEIRWVLDDAQRRLGRGLGEWQALERLYVPVKVARGLRPKLTQVEYEELERRRMTGDYQELEQLEKRRLDLREEELQEELRRPTVEWEELRENLERMVVLGDPGYGKTMLLWQEVGRRNQRALDQFEGEPVGAEGLQLAVFVRGVEMAQELAATTDLLEVLTRHVSRRHGLKDEAREALRSKLRRGDCLIALDALDEVPLGLREKLDRGLEEFVRGHGEAKLLLSSRLVGYTRSPMPVAAEDEVEVLAFEEEGMERAVRAWFGEDEKAGERLWEQIKGQGQILEVLRCPLLLRLACQVGEERRKKGEEMPRWERRGELYEAFLGDAVERWGRAAEPRPTREQRGLFLEFAGGVAEELWRQDAGRTLWGEGEVARAVNATRGRYVALNGRPDLLGDLCGAGIWVPVGADGPQTALMFTHRTMGEYLTAQALADKLQASGSEWDFVDRKAWDPNWEQVIVFLAAKLTNTPKLLRELLRRLTDETKDDLFRHRLALAAQCSGEIPVELKGGFDTEIDYITSFVFRLWWTHHEKDTKAVVPHLTRALLTLGRVNGAGLIALSRALLLHPDWDVRRGAEGLLRKLGRNRASSAFLDPLSELLRDEEQVVRCAAARVIGDLGSAAATKSVLTSLADLMGDYDVGTRNALLEAIGNLGTEAVTSPSWLILSSYCRTRICV